MSAAVATMGVPDGSTDLRAALLAGGDEGGVFWAPVSGPFDDADLLLVPDGTYVTHLHDRPMSSGAWRVEAGNLVLDHFMGGRPWVALRVTIRASELHATVDGQQLVMRRLVGP